MFIFLVTVDHDNTPVTSEVIDSILCDLENGVRTFLTDRLPGPQLTLDELSMDAPSVYAHAVRFNIMRREL